MPFMYRKETIRQTSSVPEAKEAWDALTDAQKELVEGENADPDYFEEIPAMHLKMMPEIRMILAKMKF